MTEAKPDNAAVQVLHRDLSTQAQLGMLLAVSNTMMQFLTVAAKAENDEDLERDPEMSEAEIAAESTMIKACERMDAIIGDEKRWGLDYQTRLEALFERNTQIARDVAEKQTKLIEETLARETAQKEAALEVRSPHNLFRPNLFSMEDGTWVAYLGDPKDLAGGIMGSGLSPAAALKSFDAAFAGQLSEEQSRLISKTKNENESLDKNGTEPLGETQQRREAPPTDSPGD